MKQILTIAILGMMALTACEQVDLTEEIGQEQQKKQSKDIMFVMKGITEEYSTKATLASVNMTDLWVWEGNTLLAHKVSNDSDFDTPTISLTYGSHDLTFVASKADNQSWASGVWSTTKEWDTYATVLNVTVSSNSSNSRQVQLTRRSSKVKFQTEDNVPSGVKTLHLTVANHKSLDKDLKGGSAYIHDASVDISDKVGKTCSVSVNALTESAKDEEDCNVMIEFKDASGTALYHYERTIKLKPNRAVTLKGNYFSGESNSVSITSTDWDDVNVPLYGN